MFNKYMINELHNRECVPIPKWKTYTCISPTQLYGNGYLGNELRGEPGIFTAAEIPACRPKLFSFSHLKTSCGKADAGIR